MVPDFKPSDDERETVGRTILVNVLLLVIGLSVAYGLFIGLSLGYSTDAPLRVVVSESMTPEINVNDIVVVKGVGPQIIPVLVFHVRVQGMNVSNIKIGDDIIFWWTYSTTDPIVHRVVEIRPNSSSCQGGIQFVTNGIHNAPNVVERPCESQVIGLVVGRIPYLGAVSQFLKSGLGLVLIATMIIILLAIEILEPRNKGSGKQA